jgi:hypothetical protein
MNKSNYKTIGSTNNYACKCARCGRRIEKGQGYYIGQKTARLDNMQYTNNSFVHVSRCLSDDNKLGYHSSAIDAGAVYGTKHCRCYNGMEYGLELEFDNDNMLEDEYLTTRGWTAKSDSSVRIEYTHERVTSLSMYSKILHTLEENNISCVSSHFTVSCDKDTIDFIVRYRVSIVNYLQNAIIESGKAVELFGRDFNDWAKKYPAGYRETHNRATALIDFSRHNNRYYWLNLTPAFERGNNCVEFRVNRFNGHNASQLIETMKLERAFIMTCQKYHTQGRQGVAKVQKWIDKNFR